MEYEIIAGEKKTTSTGKEKFDATLKGGEGTVIKGVTIWGDFPNFATLAVGQKVSGNISTKVNGQYTNHTLYPERPQSALRGGGNMSKVVAQKNENIKESQERKDTAIRLSGSMSNAVLIVTSCYAEDAKKIDNPIERAKYIEGKIMYFRNFLLNNHGDLKDVIDPIK